MPKNFKFQENEKVLCYHGPLMYEAKIQKCQENKDNKDGKEKTVQYLVHYLGWSKNWDEWVPEDRVVKINESSLQKQKELKDAQNKTNKNKTSAKKKTSDTKEPLTPIATPVAEKPKPKISNVSNVSVIPPISSELKDNSNVTKDIDGQRKKRIKVESSLEMMDTTATKGSTIQIEIPICLKQWLVEDWQLINQKKLIRLPAKVCVNRIADDYLKIKLNQKLSPSKESAIREAVEGIKEYFNASLGSKLVYTFEKNQFKDLIKDPEDGPKPSTVYGGPHLLRLFVKLGELLSYLNLDEKSISMISGHINDFLKYLEQNPSLFTSNEYELASNDYLKKLT